jgi:glycogen debranching enzyme
VVANHRRGAPTARKPQGPGGQRKRRLFRSGRSTLVSDLSDSLTTKSGPVFALCSTDGDIDLARNPGHGLYFHDTRFLDRSVLRLNAGRLSVLLSEAEDDHTVCELTNPDMQLKSGSALPKQRIGIRRARHLASDVTETIHVRSYETRKLYLILDLEFGASFDSMFTVRGAPPGRRGRVRRPRWQGDRLLIEYEGADRRHRTTTISFAPAPDVHRRSGVRYKLKLPPGGAAEIAVTIALTDRGATKLESRPTRGARNGMMPRLAESQIESSNPLFNRVLRRSFADLRMLLMREGGHEFFAAGVPWFVALFGRDSLITAWETLAYDFRIAAHTLRLLASYQAKSEDPWRDAQTGKILHELRVGEEAQLGEVPQTPYYGSVDSTPLFVALLAEYVRWSGDLGLYRELRTKAERCLAWIDGPGDSDGDGFLDYVTRSTKGFRNQGWKDSGNSIVNSDGSLGAPPIALVEVQGYVYMAKQGLARVARATGDDGWADRLEREAQDLRRRFMESFWMPDRGYFALALQYRGRKAEAITSNPGQALWSGIVDRQRIGDVAEALMSERLFSGWGVRTLSADEPAYNPIDYQVGAIWPHDNALIMAGLKRAGRDADAIRVFTAMFRAAALFPHYRLPELFAGFRSDKYPVPVRYPVACNPQAWAAGALPYMLTRALGLEPDALNGRLEIASPALPDWLTEVTIREVRVGSASVDLRYHRVGNDTLVAVLDRRGQLDVVVTY